MMRILIVHNSYQHRGGEDTVVDAEAALLKAAGHDVCLRVVSNDAISGVRAKIKTLINTAHNPTSGNWMRQALAESGADVVHIHNFFPLLTPSIHQAAAESGAAVVQTLHNYRLLCAGAFFLRDNIVCEKCLSGTPAWGIVHRCYRGSLPGSLAVVGMQQRARSEKTWNKHVHRFIALTEFARGKFVKGGLPDERIVVKPNFSVAPPLQQGRRNGALFVGRISQEKGVDLLIDAWKHLPDVPLTVIGEGPEYQRLKALSPPGVTWLGQQSSQTIREHMFKAKFLVQPSIWYEGFPMTIVEAFSAALPVISSNMGSMTEIVEAGHNGLHFIPGDVNDLLKVIRSTINNDEALARLGGNARATFESRYTPERNLILLEEIYRDAIELAARKHEALGKIS